MNHISYARDNLTHPCEKVITSVVPEPNMRGDKFIPYFRLLISGMTLSYLLLTLNQMHHKRDN
jgi:hypothetical protein